MTRPADEFDVVVVGAGPAGVAAATRAADLGARTALVTSGEFGGMAANDGPVPVRTLAHAARLLRETRQLRDYGIAVTDPVLDYGQLLRRVGAVVAAVREVSILLPQARAAGVEIFENAGHVGFVEPHVLVSATGRRFTAGKVIVCTGGVSRPLDLPGAELTATHSNAWALTAVPASMIVIGAGATGAQVASVFNAFGSRVQLFQAGPRILHTEDEDVSTAVAAGFRDAGMQVLEDFGTIVGFEKTADGVRMHYAKGGVEHSAEAALAVCCIGWRAETAGLGLDKAGVEVDARGFIQVDAWQRTSATYVWAAGDVTGTMMLVPQAMQAGFAAATNACGTTRETVDRAVSPVGSFTDPEYAQVGLSEAKARERGPVEVATARFDHTTRGLIDGRSRGFCKLIVDAGSRVLLGCHVVGDRAVDVVQIAAVAMAGGMTVDRLARVPFSFPTYAGVLARAAAMATRQVNRASASLALSK